MGVGLPPRKLGACHVPTCVSRLLSTHVLTSSPDSPCRGLTHTWGVTRTGGTRKPLLGAQWAGGEGPGLHLDRVETVMLKVPSPAIRPCPASSSISLLGG